MVREGEGELVEGRRPRRARVSGRRAAGAARGGAIGESL